MSFSYNLRKYAIYLLKKYNIRPKRSLGQTFLVDLQTINKIVEHANLSKSDVVLEIGGGLGFLTKKIAERAGKVITIEIDRKLIEAMKEVLDDIKNVEIIYGDALEIELPKANKVISNLPYSISTEITFKLLEEVPFEVAILTYQKEVAQRILAKPANENYGRLTIMVQFYATVEQILYIPKYYFHPIPKVDSATLKMKRKKLELSQNELQLFKEVVRNLFTQRNKLWTKVLKGYLIRNRVSKGQADKIVNECLKEIKAKRVRELTMADLVSITRIIKSSLEPNV